MAVPYAKIDKTLEAFFFHGSVNFPSTFARDIRWSSPWKRLDRITEVVLKWMCDYLLILASLFSGSDEEALSRHFLWET